MAITTTLSLSHILKDVELYGMISQDQPIERVLTDSRSLVLWQGTMFFALRSASGDGHQYIAELYEHDVRIFVVEYLPIDWASKYPLATFCLVKSSLRALQELAKFHRQSLSTLKTIVGITGSNGKTIVKEMLAHLMSSAFTNITRSPASYNSQIGVALSLLDIPQTSELALIEAGISHPQEMEHLANMIAPTHVLLTHVGSAHSSNFSSRCEHIDEKLRLAQSPSCQALICSVDAPDVMERIHALGLSSKVIGYTTIGNCDAQLRATYSYHEDGTMIDIQTERYRLEVFSPFSDEAGLHNLLASLALIYALKPEVLKHLAPQIAELTPMPMRLEMLESVIGTTIINDSYSCDIESLKIALDFVCRRARNAKADKDIGVLLSDIDGHALESPHLYEFLANLLASHGVHRVYAIGMAIKTLSNYDTLDVYTFDSVESFMASAVSKEALHHPFLLIKGARRFGFEQIVRAFSMREHDTQLEVNLSNLRSNLAFYRSLLPANHPIICMIKADAYGLGAYEVARSLQDAHVDTLAVAVVDEAKMLRRKGITSRIVVMNPQLDSFETLVQYDLGMEVYSTEMLTRVLDYARRIGQCPNMHLKVETGMHRLGICLSDIPRVAQLYCDLSRVVDHSIDLQVFSHLAVADMLEQDDFTHQQARCLNEACQVFRHEVERLSAGKISLPQLPRHLLNTAGIERFADTYAFDAVRLGIGLYGSSPTAQGRVLPVAQLTSKILQTKWIQAGDHIGYGLAGYAQEPLHLAIIPIGYADGLRRNLGEGRWRVIVRGIPCLIVGRVCMDTCMIDVTAVIGVSVGDRVIVFGAEDASLEQMAEAAHTISYEILTGISSRVPRVYLQN